MKRVVVVASLVVVAGAAVAVVRETKGPRPRAPAPMSQEAAESIDEASSTRPALAADTRARRFTRTISALARARATSEGPAQTGAEKVADAIKSQTAERNPEFEALLEREAENREWQDRTTRSFAKTYADMTDVRVQSCRCGESFCRVEISTPLGQEHQHAAFSQLQHVEGLDGMLTLKVKEDVTPPIAILYFSRAGTALPFVQGS